MSSSSASTHQLGRQVLTSVRFSVDSFLWRTPSRSRSFSLHRLGIGHALVADTAMNPRTRATAQRAASFLARESVMRSPFSSAFISGRPVSLPGPAKNAATGGSVSGRRILFGHGHRGQNGQGGNRGQSWNSGQGQASGRISPNHVRRSCTSGGLLLLGLSSPSAPAPTVVVTCTAAAADSALGGSASVQKAGVSHLARQGWQKQRPLLPSLAWTNRQRASPGQFFSLGTATRQKSTKSSRSSSVGRNSNRRLLSSRQGSNGPRGAKGPEAESRFNKPPAIPPAAAAQQSKGPVEYAYQKQGQQGAKQPPPPPPPPVPPEDAESIATSMSKYLQSHLPKIPHRPTKEELLAAASGFRQRLKIRLKWLTIRSMRPWNADEWGAFVSWFMLGHLVWILVGTTTFVSLLILTINTVVAQETLAKWVGDYLTQSAGVTIVFESAIVPKWKNGVITFHNVFVSRRPGQIKSSVKKGSSTSAAAIAAARQTQEQSSAATPGVDHLEETAVDDGNYTQFDVTIKSVDVTLSFYKWWNGKGLLKDVEVKGVRGVVDRTSVVWSDGPLDPFSFRHEHQPGDFEIERFKLEDLMVTVLQPNGFRPFSMSIFSCELPQLRKRWLFYDFLSASHVSGAFDGSLFTIHPRQVQHPMGGVPITATAAAMANDVVDNSHHSINNPPPTSTVDVLSTSSAAGSLHPSSPESALAWKKFSRLRIDGLKIDHLNRGDPGPFGWIYEGNVDIVADVMFPAEADESLVKVMSDFYDKMEEAVTSNRYIRILDGNYGGGRGRRDSAGDDAIGTVSPATDGTLDMDDDSLADETWGQPTQGHLSSWASQTGEGDGDKSEAAPGLPGAATSTAQDAVAGAAPVPDTPDEPLPQYVVMDLRLHLNDVRAAVPFFPASDVLGHTRAQSYVNAALIRPIVAYINAKRTYIPISCRVVKHLSDFDGSWTSYDCGLLDDTSAEVYAAFAADVEDQHSRVRRLKKVGFWTLSMVVHALLAGVAGDLM